MSEWKDGLPGVGVECEVKGIEALDHDYIACTISSITKHCFIADAKVGGEVCGHIRNFRFRPIKKREPKIGEVWLAGSLRGPCIMSDIDGKYPFVELDGSNSFPLDATNLTYAAPDIKSYIARELLKDTNHKDEFVLCVLKDAARLDEE